VATLAARLLAFAQAVGADVKAILLNTPAAGGQGTQFWRGDKTWATPAAGSDPWTRVKLAADYTNPLATFADITGLTFTPPANTDFIVEAELILLTTTTTNLPRVGVALPAGMQWATAEIRQAGATDVAQVQQHGGTMTTAANVQVAAGGLAVASSPRLCVVRVKGRSGASPAAIKLQLAAETAGANVCFVKAGSEMRSRVIA
jgi:hypothetical protein